MPTVLTGARILTPDDEIEGGSVIVEDGRIAEEARSYARWVVAHGVTSFVASIVGETPEDGEAALRAIAKAGPAEGGAELLGAHLEGPFVSPERRGALPEGWLRPPGAGLLRRLLEAPGGRLRLITLAPELPGAAAVLEQAVRAGCVVAVGHSDATYEEARDAFARGARHLTHALNPMRPLPHREPGPPGAALATEGGTGERCRGGLPGGGAGARPVGGGGPRGRGGGRGPARRRWTASSGMSWRRG